MASGEIRSYQDLKVWQEGMNIAEACYELPTPNSQLPTPNSPFTPPFPNYDYRC
ncbi:MAG: hypothetical protein KAF91_22560 [Nostoc sp. TH1S01]|nr:hypothetical protein [Nostoc sp. TH1S01]